MITIKSVLAILDSLQEQQHTDSVAASGVSFSLRDALGTSRTLPTAYFRVECIGVS